MLHISRDMGENLSYKVICMCKTNTLCYIVYH
jgi:hypothetical protein